MVQHQMKQYSTRCVRFDASEKPILYRFLHRKQKGKGVYPQQNHNSENIRVQTEMSEGAQTTIDQLFGGTKCILFTF